MSSASLETWRKLGVRHRGTACTWRETVSMVRDETETRNHCGAERTDAKAGLRRKSKTGAAGIVWSAPNTVDAELDAHSTRSREDMRGNFEDEGPAGKGKVAALVR